MPLVCTYRSGSSPLTRGTLHKISLIGAGERFIPAYAGNSTSACRLKLRTTVHPRLRGELSLTGCATESPVGSSPLTRGTPVQGLPPPLWRSGSSPLTRGTLIALGTDFGFFRFIPAYARNSLLADLAAFFATVHPRLRGELHGKSRAADYRAGSSPLTRGTR